MSPMAQFSAPARGVIIAGAVSLIITLMHMAASILTPLLLAVFIAIIATPALGWMRRKGVPKWGALAVIVFVLLDVGSLFALVSTGALEGFRESFPTYQERFMLLSQQVGGLLESAGMSHSQEAIPDIMDPSKVMLAVRFLLSNASGIFATGLLVLLAVIFILSEAPGLRTKLEVAFDLTPEGEARITQLLSRINRYMQIKTLTSAATGLCVWLFLWVIGIDFAPLWGIIAFLLNFVPVVGNIVMMIPAVLLALVQVGLRQRAAGGRRLSRHQYRHRQRHRAARHGQGARHLDPGRVHRAVVLGLAVRPGGHVPGGAAHRGADRGTGCKPAHPPARHHARPGPPAQEDQVKIQELRQRTARRRCRGADAAGDRQRGFCRRLRRFQRPRVSTK
jgi:AI-2 transport protein TqsA